MGRLLFASVEADDGREGMTSTVRQKADAVARIAVQAAGQLEFQEHGAYLRHGGPGLADNVVHGRGRRAWPLYPSPSPRD